MRPPRPPRGVGAPPEVAARAGVPRRAGEHLDLVRDALADDAPDLRQKLRRRLRNPASLSRKHERSHLLFSEPLRYAAWITLSPQGAQGLFTTGTLSLRGSTRSTPRRL